MKLRRDPDPRMRAFEEAIDEMHRLIAAANALREAYNRLHEADRPLMADRVRELYVDTVAACRAVAEQVQEVEL